MGSLVECEISDILTNGQGVGRIDGNVVFVWGPLPGERVRTRIRESKKSYLVGEMVETLSVSPDRVTPFCAVFGSCGGCQLQHLAYPAQLEWKRNTVVQALARIGGFDGVDVQPVVGMSEPRGYRNKMSLVVDTSNPEPEVGFYAMRTHTLVPIDDCPIVLPTLGHDLREIRRLLNDGRMRDIFAQTRHIVVRRARSSGDGVAAFTSMKPIRKLVELAETIRAGFTRLAGLSNSFAPSGENVVLGRQHSLLAGDEVIEERLGEGRFRVSVQSFFQVNSEMVERIFAYVKPRIHPQSRILDLYCGTGTFAVMFALWGATVFGLEENMQAVDEARANARLNGVEARAQFAAGRVEDFAAGEGRLPEFNDVDTVFLDPPRKGSDEGTLRAIITGNASSILYLSCNPATLARDAAILATGGFVIERVQPFDMFPQTGHIEVLMSLQRTTRG